MKNLKLNIRINKDQDFLLRELGGHTKGFEKMFNFYLDNYDMADEQSRDIHREEALDKARKIAKN